MNEKKIKNFGTDAATASAKRVRHQSAVRRRLRHLHRAKPVERSDLRKSAKSGIEAAQTEGPRPRAGISVYLGLGGCDPGTHHGRDTAGSDAGTTRKS